MGKLWMPVANFKKIHEDQNSATLQHPDGHQVKLAKNILSPHMAQQLAALPLHGQPQQQDQQKMARGGKIPRYNDGGTINYDSPEMKSRMAEESGSGSQPYGTPAPGTSSQPQAAPQGMSQPQAPQNAGIPQQQPQAQGPSPMASGVGGMFGGKGAMGLENSAMGNFQAAGKSAMNAQQAGAGQRIAADNQRMGNIQQDMDRFNNGFTAPDGRSVMGNTARIQEADAVKSDILAGNLNPNHWMEQGALPKVITAIGLIGAMSNSKGAGEQILNFVNQQQDRDMKSQIENRNTKMSVLDANTKLMGSFADGFKMTQAQNLAVYQALIEKAAATTDNGMAKAQYQNVLGTLQQKKADLVRQWTIQDVLSNGQPQQVPGQSGQGGTPNPGASYNMATDAMGNQLSGQGVNLGGSSAMWNQYNPVTMPGTNKTMFAKSKEQATEANGSIRDYKDLDDALKNVHEATNGFSPSGMLPGSTEHNKRQGAIDQLNTVVTRLAGAGKLRPQQIEALQNMTKHISSNPLPGFMGQDQQNEQLKGMATQNTGQLHNTLDQDLNNYQRPATPDGQANGG